MNFKLYMLYDLSGEFGELVSAVDTIEIDCSFVEGIIEINDSDDVDDENELVEMINNVD